MLNEGSTNHDLIWFLIFSEDIFEALFQIYAKFDRSMLHRSKNSLKGLKSVSVSPKWTILTISFCNSIFCPVSEEYLKF